MKQKDVVILYDATINKRVAFLLSTIDTRKTEKSVKGYILLQLVSRGFSIADAIKTLSQFEFFINELQAEDITLNNFDIYKGRESCLFFIKYYEENYTPYKINNPRDYYYSAYLKDFTLKTSFNEWSKIFRKPE